MVSAIFGRVESCMRLMVLITGGNKIPTLPITAMTRVTIGLQQQNWYNARATYIGIQADAIIRQKYFADIRLISKAQQNAAE
jgi:hypothetical protein